MRINKFIAQSTGISRRMADKAVAAGRVTINDQPAEAGSATNEFDIVQLDGRTLSAVSKTLTIMFHKPIGCVVSREGQGSLTIYDLLPDEYRLLKPIGRLDKNTSGLLLLTNDGQLSNELTHPRYAKTKIYEITLGKPLAPLHRQMINDHGINLADGNSQLNLERMVDGDETHWRITMHEGRNRQIRRTFESLNYYVAALHRMNFASYSLGDLKPRQTIPI